MTTIVGIQGRNWALLGADSRIADNSTIFKMVKGYSKIIEGEGFTLACAGDVRAINLLQSLLKLPKTFIAKDDAHFITGFLILAIRKVFIDAGHEKTTEGQSSHESDFLVIYNAKIYEIGSDYAWVQDSRGIYGIGSGGSFALGALACLTGVSINRSEARRWATKALEIACDYNSDSAPPFHIVIKE